MTEQFFMEDLEAFKNLFNEMKTRIDNDISPYTLAAIIAMGASVYYKKVLVSEDPDSQECLKWLGEELADRLVAIQEEYDTQ